MCLTDALFEAKRLLGDDYVILKREQIHALMAWCLRNPAQEAWNKGDMEKVFETWVVDYGKQRFGGG